MYGEVAWSGPVPFVAPSVVEDVPLPGWRRTHQTHTYETLRTVMVAQALTVPLEPSFVPFGLFCMTAVADVVSLMGANLSDAGSGKERGERGDKMYGDRGAMGALDCSAQGTIRGDGLYTLSELGTPESRYEK